MGRHGPVFEGHGGLPILVGGFNDIGLSFRTKESYIKVSIKNYNLLINNTVFVD